MSTARPCGWTELSEWHRADASPVPGWRVRHCVIHHQPTSTISCSAVGQLEDLGGDDVLLDLRSTAHDGRGPAVQVGVQPRLIAALEGPRDTALPGRIADDLLRGGHQQLVDGPLSAW